MTERLPEGVGRKWQHIVLGRIKGKASQHKCIDNCGNQAKHWSQIHNSDNCDPASYVPRCVSCHFKYDAPYKYSGRGNTSIRSKETIAKLSESMKVAAIRRNRKANGTFA